MADTEAPVGVWLELDEPYRHRGDTIEFDDTVTHGDMGRVVLGRVVENYNTMHVRMHGDWDKNDGEATHAMILPAISPGTLDEARERVEREYVIQKYDRYKDYGVTSPEGRAEYFRSRNNWVRTKEEAQTFSNFLFVETMIENIEDREGGPGIEIEPRLLAPKR